MNALPTVKNFASLVEQSFVLFLCLWVNFHNPLKGGLNVQVGKSFFHHRRVLFTDWSLKKNKDPLTVIEAYRLFWGGHFELFKSAAEWCEFWNQKQHLGLEAVSALHHNHISLGTTEYPAVDPGEIENNDYSFFFGGGKGGGGGGDEVHYGLCGEYMK